MELLATNSNPKLMKENSAEFEALTPQLNKRYFEIKENYTGTITGGVSIAPNTENGLGVDLCGGHSTKACRKGCLFIQGRGKMRPVASARVKKAVFFIKENKKFMSQLVEELAKLERKALKRNIKPCVRLNVFSDVQYEKIKVNGKTVFQLFPNIEFYDYTKNWKRDVSNIPNYMLTYSKSEEYEINQMPDMLKDQKNIAVIFRDFIPKSFHGMQVINGDVHDLRFMDKKGVIVGLTAKGSLKKDQDVEGFVFNN